MEELRKVIELKESGCSKSTVLQLLKEHREQILQHRIADGAAERLSADHSLARRLERAEGQACREFAEARRRLTPSSETEWIECAGACAVFDGTKSPVTQSFGLGLFEELRPKSLELIERFFIERGAPVLHEISPLAGVDVLSLLCRRGYYPVELSNVMYRTLGSAPLDVDPTILARPIASEEVSTWSDVSARGWAPEHPELGSFLLELGTIAAERENSICFLATIDGQPGAAAVLSLHNGVALMGGSATVPELRRRGLHIALLQERLRYASEHGCDIATMVTAVGSNAQRNAERSGFRIAYTRTKWCLPRTDE